MQSPNRPIHKEAMNLNKCITLYGKPNFRSKCQQIISRHSSDELKPPRNIVISGAPGSGKTTIARMLGEKLGWKTIDVDDDYLEPFWGMPVADKVRQMEGEGFEASLRLFIKFR